MFDKIIHDNTFYEEINPDKIANADLVVCLPSLNEGDNIAYPVSKISCGLKKYYPNLSTVIINCDNHSQDATKENFFSAECHIPRMYISTSPGETGKGPNLTNCFRKAFELDAKIVVVFDAKLTSIRTTWLPSLIEPILNGGAELVAPIYVHHKYALQLSRTLASPLMRVATGRRVRQPVGIDKAFSGRLNEIFLKYERWPKMDCGYQFDMTMMSLAAMNRAPVCQSFIPYPRIRAGRSADYLHLSEAFQLAAGSLFNLLIDSRDFWKTLKKSRPTSLYGVDLLPKAAPPQISVTAESLYADMLTHSQPVKNLWPEIFGSENADLFVRLLSGGPETCRLDIYTWRDALYKALQKYKDEKSNAKKYHIITSLVPLFYAKWLTAFHDTADLNDRQTDAFFDEEASILEEGKNIYLNDW